MPYAHQEDNARPSVFSSWAPSGSAGLVGTPRRRTGGLVGKPAEEVVVEGTILCLVDQTKPEELKSNEDWGRGLRQFEGDVAD